MDFKWIGALATIFIGFTLICNILTGTGFISQTDVNIMDQQKMTQDIDLGIIHIPIPGSGYVAGVIRMLDFKEYNDILFTGMGQIIYFGMASITFLIGFFLFITIVSIAVNKIRGV